MPDVAATIASPAFRAWHNMLCLPVGFDMDELLAAGVIADEEDWLLWRDRGWLPFIIRATDAQQVALFELVQAGMKPEQREAITPGVAGYGPDRCGVCGWLLAETWERGCVPGARRAARDLAGKALL